MDLKKKVGRLQLASATVIVDKTFGLLFGPIFFEQDQIHQIIRPLCELHIQGQLGSSVLMYWKSRTSILPSPLGSLA